MKGLFILSLIATLGMVRPLQAQDRDSSICITDSQFYISGGQLIVSMQLEVNRMLRPNESVRLTPRLADSLDNYVQLPSIYINSRKQHIVFQREQAREEKDYVELRRRNGQTQKVQYLRAVHFSEWMRYAQLQVDETSCGCGIPFRTDSLLLGYVEVPSRPVAVEQLLQPPHTGADLPKNVIEKSGSAYLDFPLNETIIYPTFSRNAEELEKIHRSIEEVTRQPQVILSAIELHGYASPEGPYKNNERLSRERTESLKRYLTERYGLADSLITTRFTPEDWEGLKRLVSVSDISHKPELLELADDALAPDQKEKKMRKKHPKEFQVLLERVLPALRRTDYVIRYTILPE
ncbi:MAG: hypothetical protein ACI363_02465 [Phocaeicola plebeius]